MLKLIAEEFLQPLTITNIFDGVRERLGFLLGVSLQLFLHTEHEQNLRSDLTPSWPAFHSLKSSLLLKHTQRNSLASDLLMDRRTTSSHDRALLRCPGPAHSRQVEGVHVKGKARRLQRKQKQEPSWVNTSDVDAFHHKIWLKVHIFGYFYVYFHLPKIMAQGIIWLK